MKVFSLAVAVLVAGIKISAVTGQSRTGPRAVDDPNVVTTYNTPVTFDAIGNDKNFDGTPLLLGPDGSGSTVTINAVFVVVGASVVGKTSTSGEVITLPNGSTVSANFTDGMITYTPPYWDGNCTAGVPLSQDTFYYRFKTEGDVNTPTNNGFGSRAAVTITITSEPACPPTSPPTRPPTSPPTGGPTSPPTTPPTRPPTSPPTGGPTSPLTSPPTRPPTSPPTIGPTSPPTSPPTDCDPATGGCQGDPHFKTWRGKHFDFHGECDLVLLHSSAFESGLGLDVHIRTKIRRDMSYISSAALRIGSDVLEVESQGVYYLNGVLSAALPAELSGIAFSHTQPNDKQHVFEVHLGGRERIKLKTYKDFVSVLIEQGRNEHFGDSAGLMGDFRLGHMIARDGKSVIDDANAFGQEWQVLDTEPSLFQTVRLPQHPQQVCTLPPPMQASQLRRRLSESSSVDELAAEKACAHWGEGKDDCVFDVLMTGDLEMAVVGAY
jgi:hypothetical protein